MAQAKRRPKIVKPPILFAQTQKLITQIEAKLDVIFAIYVALGALQA